jgi:hypothetical protein
MSHYPYEEWILSDGTLTPQQAKAVRDHTEKCAQCHQLQKQWQAAKLEIKDEGFASPGAGFTARWQNSLADRRALQQKRSAQRLVLFLVGLAVITLGFWAAYFVSTTSPSDFLALIFSSAARLLIFYQEIKLIVLPVIFRIPPVIYLMAWVLALGTTLILALVWGGAIWHFSFRKPKSGELVHEGVKIQ